MGDAVIYAWREEQGDVWTGEWALDRKDKWVPAEANKYILATPEALAASPEVAKLIAEAEARGLERAAQWHDDQITEMQLGADMTSKHLDEAIADHQEAAAAIRAANGEAK